MAARGIRRRRARGGDGFLERHVHRLRDVDRPRVGGLAARVRHDPDPLRVGVPGLHRGSLVRRGEGGEDGVARVDVGEVAVDDLGLVPLRAAAEVAAHRVDGLPVVLADEHASPGGGTRPRTAARQGRRGAPG